MICTLRQIFPRFFATLAVLLALSVATKAQVVDIQSDQQSVVLDTELLYWPSVGRVPGPAFEAYRSGEFSTEKDTASLGFGHPDEIWVALDIRNDSFDDGRQGDAFVVTYDGLFVMGYRLFLVREDDLTENLLDYSAYQHFDRADWAVNRLKTPEFIVSPSETVTLLAHLQLGGKGHPGMALTRSDTLTQQSLTWTTGMVAFYTSSISLLFVTFGFLLAMRSIYGLFYVFLEAAVLLHIAFGDGLLFRFVFPQNPELHLSIYSSIPLFGIFFLSMVMAFGFRLGDRPNHAISYGLMAFGAVAFLLAVLTFTHPSVGWILVAVIVVAVGTLPGPFLPREVYQRVDVPGIGLRWVITVSILAANAILIWVFWGWSVDGSSVRQPIKLVYIFTLMAVLIFIGYNLLALRKRHLKEIATRMSALELEAAKSRQLLETERAYIRAREAASAHQRQLATASHDIKQPLMSLRMTFDAISSGMEPAVRTRLAESFGYLETLSKSYVDSALAVEDSGDRPRLDEEKPPETYSLSVPLNTVHEMFKGEAVSKGIEVRVVDTTLETQAMPLVVMRILTNLVSNAVKYTDEGAVLIGVRRNGPETWVCDTGRGMSATEIRTYRTAYQKGDSSTGHGLGLSVCFELAAANDIDLTVTSTPNRGSVFRLSLALHRPG